MSKTAEIREPSSKEMIAAKRLTVVHKQRQRDTSPTPEEKPKAWVMPPLRERYIKQKKHDPL